jgi:hypothetical protein
MRAQGDDTAAAGGAGDAPARPAQDTTEPVRKEIGAVRDETLTALGRLGAGSLLRAGAGTCGVLALSAAQTTPLRALASAVPERTAPAVPTGAYTAGAAAPAMAGRNRIHAAARAAV